MENLKRSSKASKMSKKSQKAKISPKISQSKTSKKGSKSVDRVEEGLKTSEEGEEESESKNGWERFLENLENITALNGEIKRYLPKDEFQNLRGLYVEIQRVLKGSYPQEKKQWMKKIFPFISKMSMDLQMTLQDLFEEDKKPLNIPEEASENPVVSNKNNPTGHFEVAIKVMGSEEL
jgi:hypothetical protein